MTSDADLEAAVNATMESYGHPIATAPMGTDDDPRTVVDELGAVRGLAHRAARGRRLDLPRAHQCGTFTVIMAAEHIARLALLTAESA